MSFVDSCGAYCRLDELDECSTFDQMAQMDLPKERRLVSSDEAMRLAREIGAFVKLSMPRPIIGRSLIV